MTYFGLYYPFIHFRDEGWLKLTALYWDGMKRIVPTGARLRDSDEVKRLVDAGFVENEHPGRATFEVAKPFRELVGGHSDALREHFGVAKRRTWPRDPYTLLYAPPRADTKLAYVLDGKMDQHLVSDLFACELVSTRSDNPRWIGMHPRLANLYMTSLAETVARDHGAYPLTDGAFDHVAMSGLTMERLAAALFDQPELAVQVRPEREIEGTMATLALSYVVPAEPAAIPAEKIADFRETYAEERSLFQSEITNLTAASLISRTSRTQERLSAISRMSTTRHWHRGSKRSAKD